MDSSLEACFFDSQYTISSILNTVTLCWSQCAVGRDYSANKSVVAIAAPRANHRPACNMRRPFAVALLPHPTMMI